MGRIGNAYIISADPRTHVAHIRSTEAAEGALLFSLVAALMKRQKEAPTHLNCLTTSKNKNIFYTLYNNYLTLC
jgi:hypothetical protein